MNKNSVILFLLAIVLVFSSTACTDQEKDAEAAKEGTQSSGKTLKVYYGNWYNSLNSSVIRDFKELHRDITIEEESINLDDADSFKKRFTTELMAGETADIISLPAGYFPGGNKLMASGALCDLNPIIAEDKEFELGDYNEVVMDSGVYKGKRYVIPVDYGFSYLYTYKSLLDENNIRLDLSNWTWDALHDIIKKFNKANKGNIKYSFLKFNIGDILYSGKNTFVDYEAKRSSFNSSEFIDELNIYKDILSTVCPEEERGSLSADVEKRLKTILFGIQSGGISDMILSNDIVKKAEGEDAIILPCPSMDGKMYTSGSVYNAVAIASKSKYPKEAFDFIKIILSEKKQVNSLISNPVNKAVLDEAIQNLKLNKVNEENIKRITDMVANIKDCDFGDDSYSIISGEMDDFISGRKTAEQTAKTIDEKVTLFLNE